MLVREGFFHKVSNFNILKRLRGLNVFIQLVASVFGQGSFRSKYKGEGSRSLNRTVVFHQRFHS